MRPNQLPEILKGIKAFRATKFYPSEKFPNPELKNLSTGEKWLHEEHKPKIWLLRSNGDLVIGVKSFDKKSRIGHPTLAMPEKNYDGGVLFAGWIVQRENFLLGAEYTGRYSRHDLSEVQMIALIKYISSVFIDASEEQPIVFIRPNLEEFSGHIYNRNLTLLDFYAGLCLLYKITSNLQRKVEIFIDEVWLLNCKLLSSKVDISTLLSWDKDADVKSNGIYDNREVVVVGTHSDLKNFNTQCDLSSVLSSLKEEAFCNYVQFVITSRVQNALINDETLVVLALTNLIHLQIYDENNLAGIFSCMKNVTWLDLKSTDIADTQSKFNAKTISKLHEDIEIIDLRDNNWENNLSLLCGVLDNLPSTVQYVLLDHAVFTLLENTGYAIFIKICERDPNIIIFNNDEYSLQKTENQETENTSKPYSTLVAAGIFSVPLKQPNSNNSRIYSLAGKNLGSKKDVDIIQIIKQSKGYDTLILCDNLLGRKNTESLVKVLQAIPNSISTIDLSNNAWETTNAPEKVVKILEGLPNHVKEVIIQDKKLYSSKHGVDKLNVLNEAMKAFNARNSLTL